MTCFWADPKSPRCDWDGSPKRAFLTALFFVPDYKLRRRHWGALWRLHRSHNICYTGLPTFHHSLSAAVPSYHTLRQPLPRNSMMKVSKPQSSRSGSSRVRTALTQHRCLSGQKGGRSHTLDLCLQECVYNKMPLSDTRERVPTLTCNDRCKGPRASEVRRNTCCKCAQASRSATRLAACHTTQQPTQLAAAGRCCQHGTLVPHDTAGRPNYCRPQRHGVLAGQTDTLHAARKTQKYRKRPRCCWQMMGAG